MAAAIYAARQRVETCIFERGLPGGTMNLASVIENYPGFPEPIAGMELSKRFREQVKKQGAKFIQEEAKEIRKDGRKFIIKTDKGEHESEALLLATGTEHKKLNIQGEGEFLGKGLSYCVACEGPFFKGKVVAVVGGGNSAVDGALVLGGIAKKVYLIHRRDKLRADKILQERLLESRVEIIWDTNVTELIGDEMLKGIKTKNVKTGKEKRMDIDGIFIEIGVVPDNKLAKQLGVELAEGGYVKVECDQSTSVPGVFAAGDLTGRELQLMVAVGDAVVAAVSTYKYLKYRNNKT